MQEQLIFYPEKLSKSYKFDFPFPFQELNWDVEQNIMLNGLLCKVPDSKGLIVYFHGNAGSLKGWGYVSNEFTRYGYDFFIYDYRGFGKSTGSYTKEAQMHDDASFIYSSIQEKLGYKEEDMIIFGRSLGTGVATKLASNNKPRLLILETPYYRFLDVAQHHYPYIPAALILKYKLETYKYITNVPCPVYIFHGTSDETIPYSQSKKLADLSPNIQLITINNGHHNDLSDFKKYQEEFSKLLLQRK